MMNASALINSKIGGSIKELENCKEFYEDMKERQKLLTAALKKCKGFRANGTSSSKKQKVDGAESEPEVQICKLQESVFNLGEELQEHIATIDAPLNALANQAQKTQDTDKRLAYAHCVEGIDGASNSIQSFLQTESVDQALTGYLQLVKMLDELKNSRCNNLVNYLIRTVKHWHDLLTDKLCRELSILMKEMKWPFVSVLTKPAASKNPLSEDVIKKNLEKLFRQLLQVQLPSSLSTADVKVHPLIASLPNWRPFLLPIDLLIEPLRKRFKFHFYGSKQTNNLDKPEWFFTQLLTWTKDHTDYLSTVIQPILWKAGYTFVNAKVDFMRGIHLIAMEKMITCLPDLLYDEHLYSHFIHETLSFHSDMCRLYDYPTDEPSCLHVLTAEEPFKKWLHIERKFAWEKMDEMTSSTTAWDCYYNSQLDDDDRTKAPECAESFITLLLSITDRYKYLPYPLCQLHFVKMQLELLEDYRIRLVQIKGEAQPGSKLHYAILNTAYHVTLVLQNWTEEPYHLQRLGDSSSASLLSMLSKHANYSAPDSVDMTTLDDGVVNSTIFDESMESFTYVQKDMINASVNQFTADLKVKVKSYADNSLSLWTGLNHLKHKEDQALISLSESACDIMRTLQAALVSAQEGLQRHLFNLYWQQLVSNLDDIIYTTVVTQNYFSEGGAIQFNYDMTRNLFAIVGNYTIKPENLMKKIKESCLLLTLKVGDAVLLKASLRDALHTIDSSDRLQDPVALIEEQGLYHLHPEDAELVLSRRNDLVI